MKTSILRLFFKNCAVTNLAGQEVIQIGQFRYICIWYKTLCQITVQFLQVQHIIPRVCTRANEQCLEAKIVTKWHIRLVAKRI